MTTTHNPIEIDLLICPDWVIPIEPANSTLSAHAVAVHQGKIVEILPNQEATLRYAPKKIIKLPGQVVMPGLVNLHTHAAMTLFRGYADDLPLMRWLNERIWPAEARHVGSDFVYAGTLLACAEMLRGGVTTFNDMYFFPESAANAVIKTGIRASIGLVVIEFPSAYASDADDYLSKGLSFRDNYKGYPLLSFCLAPHAPYTVSDSTFTKVATLAAQLDVPIHTHLHETRSELDDSLKQFGQHPIHRLHRLGLLSPQLIAVHTVHLTPPEIELLAHYGCHVAHCPTSNMKLGSGIAPLSGIHIAGINIGFGTDGAASNNRIDIFQEMRHAALLAKGASEDATMLYVHTVLRSATLGGANALGLGDKIGSLLPGKDADMIAVNLTDWPSQPCFDPASHLVYATGRDNVSHTWVAGNLVMQNGKPQHIDVQELLELSTLWHTRLTS